ncbi:hypothetical protein Tco_0385477 [Tanacetum coccineum]
MPVEESSSLLRPTRARGIDMDLSAELAELHEHDTQDLYALLEDAQDRDNMDGEGGGLCFPRVLGSLDKIESGDSSGDSDPS